MDGIKLNINRDNSFVGAAMPYRIMVNGKEVSLLKIGNNFSFEIPNAQSTLKVLMLGNSFTFHKIEKEVVLFPNFCESSVINCKVYTKPNWLGLFSLGLLQAIGRMEIEVQYI